MPPRIRTPFLLEEKRLRLGLPDGRRDIVPMAGFPLDYGFGDLNGVHFQKGCYIGQETTARMHWKKLVRKRLVPVLITGPLPAPGTKITGAESGVKAGEIRSSLPRPGFPSLALAVLRLETLGNLETPENPAPRFVLRAGTATVSPILPGWLNQS